MGILILMESITDIPTKPSHSRKVATNLFLGGALAAEAILSGCTVEPYTVGVVSSQEALNRSFYRESNSIFANLDSEENRALRERFREDWLKEEEVTEVIYKNGSTAHFYLPRDYGIPSKEQLDFIWNITREQARTEHIDFEPVSLAHFYVGNFGDLLSATNYLAGESASIINLDNDEITGSRVFWTEFTQILLSNTGALEREDREKIANTIGITVYAADHNYSLEEYIRLISRTRELPSGKVVELEPLENYAEFLNIFGNLDESTQEARKQSILKGIADGVITFHYQKKGLDAKRKADLVGKITAYLDDISKRYGKNDLTDLIHYAETAVRDRAYL